MSKERWLWLLLAGAALFGGVLGGKACGHKTTMMVLDSGKVYPSPRNGDILKFVDKNNNAKQIKWVGPSGTGISPCLEHQSPATEQTTSDTCTVNFLSKKLKIYHYNCPDPADGTADCVDPTVPGPKSKGGGGGSTTGFQRWLAWWRAFFDLDSSTPATSVKTAGAGVTIVNHLTGEALPDGASSGVWYFPNDGSAGGFTSTVPHAIPVSTYGDATKHDRLVWEDVGDTAWTVKMADNKTCVEGQAFGSSGTNICTVTSTATAQYYCVQYFGSSPGNAILSVNGAMPSGDPPALPANCN